MTDENEKKIIYVDMDGVLVDLCGNIAKEFAKLSDVEKDFYGDQPDNIEGVFDDADPIAGAVDAITKLYESGKYELYIASTSPWNNNGALVSKLKFVKKYFGDIFYKRVIFTHNKQLLAGDYLIDDRFKNGAGEFKGEHTLFGSGNFPDWDSVLKYLL